MASHRPRVSGPAVGASGAQHRCRGWPDSTPDQVLQGHLRAKYPPTAWSRLFAFSSGGRRRRKARNSPASMLAFPFGGGQVVTARPAARSACSRLWWRSAVRPRVRAKLRASPEKSIAVMPFFNSGSALCRNSPEGICGEGGPARTGVATSKSEQAAEANTIRMYMT